MIEKDFDSIAFPPQNELPVETNPIGEDLTTDIKESLELAKALSLVLNVVVKAASDGSLNIWDLKAVLELVSDYKIILEGFKGAHLIPSEVKKLSKEDLEALVDEFFPVLESIKEIIKLLK